MFYLGADPGLKGAVAIYDSITENVEVFDMPLRQEGPKHKVVCDRQLIDLLDRQIPFVVQRAVVEQISAMPGQGVTSMFRFGLAYGTLRTALAAFDFDYDLVRPNVWKRAMGVGADKESSLVQCLELFGDRHQSLWFGKRQSILDGRCEAALLAYYAYHTATTKA